MALKRAFDIFLQTPSNPGNEGQKVIFARLGSFGPRCLLPPIAGLTQHVGQAVSDWLRVGQAVSDWKIALRVWDSLAYTERVWDSLGYTERVWDSLGYTFVSPTLEEVAEEEPAQPNMEPEFDCRFRLPAF